MEKSQAQESNKKSQNEEILVDKRAKKIKKGKLMQWQKNRQEEERGNLVILVILRILTVIAVVTPQEETMKKMRAELIPKLFFVGVMDFSDSRFLMPT